MRNILLTGITVLIIVSCGREQPIDPGYYGEESGLSSVKINGADQEIIKWKSFELKYQYKKEAGLQFGEFQLLTESKVHLLPYGIYYFEAIYYDGQGKILSETKKCLPEDRKSINVDKVSLSVDVVSCYTDGEIAPNEKKSSIEANIKIQKVPATKPKTEVKTSNGGVLEGSLITKMEELKIKFGGPSRTRTDRVKQAIDEARQNHADFSDSITDSGSSVDCEFVKTRFIDFDKVNTALTSPEKEALKEVKTIYGEYIMKSFCLSLLI